MLRYSSLGGGSLYRAAGLRTGRETLEASADPGAADAPVAHDGAGVRRLYGGAVAHVDRHMVAESGAAVEDEVAGLQGGERHLGAGVLLIGGGARYAHAGLRVAVLGEAGAVETGGALAAVHIRDAEIPLGDGDDCRAPRAARVGDGSSAGASAAGTSAGGGLRAGLRRRGGRLLGAVDLALEPGRHVLELALQGEHLLFLRTACADQLGRLGPCRR